MGIEWEQREILFRAWRKDYGQWLRQRDGTMYYKLGDFPDNIVPVIVTQYIEKIDNHESKIFEGDIVKFEQHTFAGIGVIRYYDSRFGIFNTQGFMEINFIYSQNMKIIGNIFENPELMEGEDDA